MSTHFEHSSSSTSIPNHLLDDYSSGFMSNNASAAGFMSSAAATGQDSFAQVPDLRDRVNRQPEHREDGYKEVNGQPTYFGREWIDEQAARHRLLTSDPEYEFLSLVAGFSGRQPESLFDRDALDQHAKRMLQRAAVADELGKSALTDLDRTQSLLETFEKRGGKLVDNLTDLTRAQQDILHDQNAGAK